MNKAKVVVTLFLSLWAANMLAKGTEVVEGEVHEQNAVGITILPQGYVINATREEAGKVESDFLLRGVKARNNTSNPVTITGFRFDVKAKGKTVKQVAYPEEITGSLARDLKQHLKNIHGEVARMVFGTDGFWDNERISDTPLLNPGEELGLVLQHFNVLDKYPVDECVVTVFYTQNGMEEKASCSIPVVQYDNKNSYIFPLKGAWLAGENYDYIYGHRKMYSQEFAVDFVQLTPDFWLVTDPRAASEDYCFYGNDVYAVADGEVVSCFDGMPDNPPGLGSRLPQEQWDTLKETCGFVAGVAGNYVILKHPGGEYSFYAHLIPGSLKVRKGQKVKQGQVIGHLGNTGNSDCPHLHFHLMDGPDILSARGLPCYFTNLKDIVGEPLPFIQQNYSIVHAE